MTQNIITPGDLFTPTPQYGTESSDYLALEKKDDKLLCIRANSSGLIDSTGAGPYDVWKDGILFHGNLAIQLPFDTPHQKITHISSEALGFIQSNYLAAVTNSPPPPRNHEIGVFTGKVIHNWSDEERVAKKISKDSQLYQLNEYRKQVAGSSRLEHELFKRMLIGDKENIPPVMKIWQHPQLFQPLDEKFGRNIFIQLSGSTLKLRMEKSMDQSQPLFFCSAEHGFFEPIKWEEEKTNLFFSLEVPETIPTLLLSNYDCGILLDTLPLFEEYSTDQVSLALSLFAAHKAADLEDFSLLPNHIHYYNEKRSLFPKGFLDGLALTEGGKNLPSLLDKIGHLTSVGMCCAYLADQVRMQLFQQVEKMITCEPDYEPAHKTIFWAIGKNIVSKEHNDRIQFPKRVYKVWYKIMTQFRENDFSHYSELLYKDMLEFRAFKLTRNLQKKWLIYRAQELAAITQSRIANTLRSIKKKTGSLLPDSGFLEAFQPGIATMDASKGSGSGKYILRPGAELSVGEQFALALNFVASKGYYSVIWLGMDEWAVLNKNTPFDSESIQTELMQVTEPSEKELLLVVESSARLLFLTDHKDKTGDELLMELEESAMQSDIIMQISYFDYKVIDND